MASAVCATYDIVGDHVNLTATPGFDPSVTTEGQTLKAKLIDFSPRAGTAKATGEVIAQIVSRQNGPSADGTAMFPSGKPVFVNSDSVTMRQATKLAVFSGHVRAWQDDPARTYLQAPRHDCRRRALGRGGVLADDTAARNGAPRRSRWSSKTLA